ncbi:MAG: protein-disulfide reductase DsbD family protein [Alphaproteobacteria bacterium]|nr:protein-disulfide reductase DsbD family protein [Alphaproteobacteria bacterium]
MHPFTRYALALLLLAPLTATAQEAPLTSPIAKATLLVDAPRVKAGEAIAAGVHFTLPPHWHIYWQNPGDSGIPTTLSWELPEGLSAGEIAWPAPERFAIEGIVGYGYSNEVTLPVTLTPARDGLIGDVTVKANWLVCKDICIPESATLTAPLAANPEGATHLATAQAHLPQPFTGEAHFSVTPQSVTLTLRRATPWENAAQAWFAPVEDGLIANEPIGAVTPNGNDLQLTFARGAAAPIDLWHGIIHYMQDGKPVAAAVTATRTEAAAEPAAAPRIPAGGASSSLLLALALAFVGGLILNIMPCVLPILALKALALAKKAEASRLDAAKQGLSFTAGVVVSFLLIAGLMLALKASGSAIGWGFQLQNPNFVGLLALVMLLVSASLFGFFELPVLYGERATGVDESKLRGSFFTGVLAVMVATPCSAPFMATAIGATLSMPTLQALLVFATLGLGMAAPFLTISLWPAARRLLPKPGAWMHRFKQILGVPMLATALWLIYVLAQLLQPVTFDASDGHAAYSAPRLAQLRAEGTPVLVDATAAWCLTCKVNERVALKPDSMQQFFREKGITLMVADWTTNDPAITDYLTGFGRNGVPLYVYYPAHGEPKVLPQILTPSIVREAIEGANAHD